MPPRNPHINPRIQRTPPVRVTFSNGESQWAEVTELTALPGFDGTARVQMTIVLIGDRVQYQQDAPEPVLEPSRQRRQALAVDPPDNTSPLSILRGLDTADLRQIARRTAAQLLSEEIVTRQREDNLRLTIAENQHVPTGQIEVPVELESQLTPAQSDPFIEALPPLKKTIRKLKRK